MKCPKAANTLLLMCRDAARGLDALISALKWWEINMPEWGGWKRGATPLLPRTYVMQSRLCEKLSYPCSRCFAINSWIQRWRVCFWRGSNSRCQFVQMRMVHEIFTRSSIIRPGKHDVTSVSFIMDDRVRLLAMRHIQKEFFIRGLMRNTG